MHYFLIFNWIWPTGLAAQQARHGTARYVVITITSPSIIRNKNPLRRQLNEPCKLINLNLEYLRKSPDEEEIEKKYK